MRPATSRFEHMRSGAERAAESHTEYAARMLGSKPTQTLAGSMQQPPQSQGDAGGAAGKPNPFQANSGPQSGKVISVTRSEVFGSTRTVLRVLMDRGGERTVNADANSGNVKVAMDVAEGDAVKLVSTGPQHWEWAKVAPVGEKVRKKRKVFDTDALLGPDGLQKIHDQFHLLKWETRPAYETKSLSQIVSMYKEWAFALWPKVSFPMLVGRVEKLGSNAAVKEALNDMRYGRHIDWEQYRAEEGEEGGVAAARKKAKQAQLSANAAEIFDAYAATLQPGIRAAKADADSGVGAGDEMDDDELNRLLDKYSGGGAAAASSATGTAGKPTTAAALKASSAAAKKAAAASAEDDRVAVELERRYRESLDNDNDDVDLHARASNVWTVASSKAAAAAQSAAQEAADEAEAQALRTSRPGKKRRAVVDSDDEEEAHFAPLSSRNDSVAVEAEAAAAEDGQAQPAEDEAVAQQGGAAVAAEEPAAAEAAEAEGASVAADVAEAADSSAPVRTDTATQVLADATNADAMVVDAAAEPAPEPAAELVAEADVAAASAAADAEPLAETEPSQGEPAPSQQDLVDEVDEDALANFLDDDAPASQAAAPAAAESREATQVQEATAAPMDTASVAADTAAAVAAPEGQPQASLEPTQVL